MTGRKLAWALAIGSTTCALVVGAPGTGGAWYSKLNRTVKYYVPGPPPGSYLSACLVRSSNGVTGSSPYASINPIYNKNTSRCTSADVQVVYDINGSLEAGQLVPASANQTATSTGPYGAGLVAGSFTACNVYGYCASWSTSWINGSRARRAELAALIERLQRHQSRGP